MLFNGLLCCLTIRFVFGVESGFVKFFYSNCFGLFGRCNKFDLRVGMGACAGSGPEKNQLGRKN